MRKTAAARTTPKKDAPAGKIKYLSPLEPPSVPIEQIREAVRRVIAERNEKAK